MEKRLIAAGLFVVLVTLSVFGQDSASKNGIVKGLWLAFDFENGIAPSGGSFKEEVTPYFSRKTTGIAPDGVEFDKDTPRLVDGLNGQGIYIGGETRNLLKPNLADIAFPEGKVTGIDSVNKAKIEQVEDDDAWFGESVLKIKTAKKLGSGISIPIMVSGGGCYVFSLHLKGKGTLKLIMTAEESPENDIGPERKIRLADKWERHAVWIYAVESSKATIKLVSTMGKRIEFMVDGLQLEKKKKLAAQFTKKIYPYGKGFSPAAWVPGRKKTSADSYYIGWKKKGSFPAKEGTYSVWVKPEFYTKDAEAHAILARYYIFNEFRFETYSTYSFFRGNNAAENKKKNPFGFIRFYRPNTITKGKWCYLTATWSNKDRKSKLYLNGKLVGECLSKYGTDPKHIQGILHIGTYQTSLNGTMDNIKIYSRALSPEEVKQEYKNGLKYTQ